MEFGFGYVIEAVERSLTSCVVISDRPTIRLGLSALLRAMDLVHLVGVAADGDSYVGMLHELEPQAVLIDVDGRSFSPFEVAALSYLWVSQVRCIGYVSPHQLALARRLSERHPDMRFVLDDGNARELQRTLCGDISAGLAQLTRASDVQLKDSLVEVIAEMASRGGSNAEIGKRICLSSSGVKRRVEVAMDRTGLRSREQLVGLCVGRGLVTPNDPFRATRKTPWD
jgi:DNA-binding NarL/FixJ family response regulator